jgi:hypothetical protein
LLLSAQIAIPLRGHPCRSRARGLAPCLLPSSSDRGAARLCFYCTSSKESGDFRFFSLLACRGPARFFGLAAGHLLAYPPSAFLTGRVLERGAMQSIRRVASALLSGQAVIFFGVCMWLAAGMGLAWSSASSTGCAAFYSGQDRLIDSDYGSRIQG